MLLIYGGMVLEKVASEVVYGIYQLDVKQRLHTLLYDEFTLSDRLILITWYFLWYVEYVQVLRLIKSSYSYTYHDKSAYSSKLVIFHLVATKAITKLFLSVLLKGRYVLFTLSVKTKGLPKCTANYISTPNLAMCIRWFLPCNSEWFSGSHASRKLVIFR